MVSTQELVEALVGRFPDDAHDLRDAAETLQKQRLRSCDCLAKLSDIQWQRLQIPMGIELIIREAIAAIQRGEDVLAHNAESGPPAPAAVQATLGNESPPDASPQRKEKSSPSPKKYVEEGSLPRGVIVRHTFIDVERLDEADDDPVSPKRSSTAPPKKGLLFPEDDSSSDFEPSSGQAKQHFPPKIAASLPCTPIKKEPNVCRRSRESLLRPQQEELICSCGATFAPEGLYCYNCGSSKLLHQQNMAAVARPKRRLRNRPLPASFYQSSPPALEQGGAGDADAWLGEIAKTLRQVTEVSESSPMAQTDNQCSTAASEIAVSSSSCCQTSNASEIKNALGDIKGTETFGYPSQCPQQESMPADQITTLMLCDLPCHQTGNQLVEAINQHGFADAYDLLYVYSVEGRPKPKLVAQFGLSYACVNFKKPEYAIAFTRAFLRFSWLKGESEKQPSSRPAKEQGFHSNLKVYSDSQRHQGHLLTFLKTESPLESRVTPNLRGLSP